MHITGSYTFKADRQAVWDTLLDPETIAHCMPGKESFAKIGEDQYEAQMRIGIGPIKGSYKGRIRLSEQQPPESYRMGVEGGGGPGNVKGSGLLTLRAENGGTAVSYEGDAQISGRIASVGQRLLGVSAKQLINQFFKCMEARLEEGAVQRAAGSPSA